MLKLLVPLALCVGLGGCVHDPYYHGGYAPYGTTTYGHGYAYGASPYGYGYGYGYDASPSYYHGGTTLYYGGHSHQGRPRAWAPPGRPHAHAPGRGERRPDRDRDGIPDRVDRDRDNDGVPNRHDRRPDNPRRR